MMPFQERETRIEYIENLNGSNKKRKFAFWLVAYTFAITMVESTLPTPLYPIYSARLGLSDLMITIIYAAYAVGVIFALLAFGKWSDQIGRRPLLYGGLAFSAISAILFLAGANSLGVIFVGRLFSGLSVGIFTGTATAAVVELGSQNGNQKRATMVATAANMGGLGVGPLIAGLLAEYAPLPLHLSFIIDLALIISGFWCVWYAPETVTIAKKPKLGFQRLGLPSQVRSVFIPAAIAGFAGFAVCGFFTAVSPAVLGKLLKIPNHAVIGIVVFILFSTSIAGQFIVKWLSQRQAMIWGCLVLIAGTVLTCAGIAFVSLLFIFLGAIVCGAGQGLAFRAGMEGITAASPENQRGEIISTFFVVLYIAISIPVIGLGVMVKFFGLQKAGIDFAIGVAALTFIAFLILLVQLLRNRKFRSIHN